ncbi:transcriptional regulator [uncultured Cellulomonas sp.]|uniref:transcriptional regulator n=1 Tax=uncultured Cellulomonas sp. TaxID=189682 RepID=UPI002627136D|nr:transcriptional regulator [uncultured Cellulomonas sp.]
MSSPLDELDPVLNAPKRLAALAMVSSTESVDFAYLRTRLGLNDSDLSKQMASLDDAGYVRVTKSGRGPGATTTYAVTASGRKALVRHRRALQAVLGLQAG